MAQKMERRRALVGGVALGMWTLMPSLALSAPQALPAAVRAEVRSVVQAQLDAFAKDDAVLAFSYATPALRDAIGGAAQFMAMVRSSYPAVVRPRAVLFFEPEAAADQVLQRVQMTDAQGGVWIALYQLEQQPDKHWRIAGCFLKESHARVV